MSDRSNDSIERPDFNLVHEFGLSDVLNSDDLSSLSPNFIQALSESEEVVTASAIVSESEEETAANDSKSDNEPMSMTSEDERFAQTTVDQRNAIRDAAESKNTKKQTKNVVKIFRGT